MLSHNYSFYFLISYSQDDEGNNSPPIASNSSATTTIGQPTDIQLEVSDAENNQLQLTIVDQPQFGTLGEMNPTTNTVTYTPNPDAIAGSDSFTFTVNDGTVDSQPATVTIAVVDTVGTPPDAAVNDTQPTGSEIIEQPAQVDGDTVGTPPDAAVNDTQPTGNEIIEQPAQVDGDTVGTPPDAAVNDTQPTGSENIEQPAQVDGDTVGTDADTGTGTDTDLGLESLLGPDETPQVDGDTVGTDADTGTGTDTDLGLESLLGPDETPQVDGDTVGTDADTGTGTDTDLGLESLLGLDETPTTADEISTDNSPPVASNSSATTTIGQPTDIQLEVSDAENNQLQLTIVDQPQFGTLGEMNPTTNTVTYTPNPDAIAGSDSFTFTVNDGTVDSQPATVSITLEVTPNQPPTAQPVSDTLVQGQSKDIVLKGSDPDTEDELVFFIVNGPQNGQLGEINQETGVVSYTPNEGYTGEDTFTYIVNDLTVDSNETTVTVNVQAPPNKPPTAQAGSTSVVQGTPKDIKLNATDPDTDDKLVFSLVNGPQNGQLGEINQETGVVSYTPNEGYTGEDTFTYKVNDGTVDSEPIQVTITVQAPPNKPPTAQAGSTSVVQGTPKDIKLNATDPDTDDKLVFSLVNGPQNGQLGEINQETGVVSYTPNEGYTGEDTFTYKVNDGTVDSEPIQVTITVQAPPNKPPTAQAGSTSVVQGTPKDIKLNATDPDTDDKLVFSLVNGPQNGQLGEINQETGAVSYTPNEGYTGEDTFTYKVNDGTVDSEPIQVTITVQAPPNKPPTAQAGSTSVVQGTPKDIKLNATDPDTDDKLVFSIVKQPTKGKLGEINADRNTVTYTPNPNVTSGTDIFSFKVNDDTVDSAEAIVTVNVQDPHSSRKTIKFYVEKQEIKDNDKDGIAYEIDDEPNKKSTKFRDINGTTFGEVLNYGDQTINIFKADTGKKIIVISVSSKGDEPALISSCNEKENFVESGDRLELRCKVSTN